MVALKSSNMPVTVNLNCQVDETDNGLGSGPLGMFVAVYLD